jgi:hypothetical protein
MRHHKHGLFDQLDDNASNILALTGPFAMGHAFHVATGIKPVVGYHGNGIRTIAYIYRPGCASGLICRDHSNGSRDEPQEESTIIFWTKYPGYKQDFSWYPNKKVQHYTQMFQQGRIFRDIL